MVISIDGFVEKSITQLPDIVLKFPGQYNMLWLMVMNNEIRFLQTKNFITRKR